MMNKKAHWLWRTTSLLMVLMMAFSPVFSVNAQDETSPAHPRCSSLQRLSCEE